MDTVNGSTAVAGYDETRQLIINTLMGRPANHEITPQEHQDFALTFLNYARSVELISASTLIGFAEANTVPVQPENANVAYVSTLANGSTITFNNFHGQDGSSIQVTTDSEHAGLIVLLRRWELGYWEVHTVPITLSEIGDISWVVKYRPTGFTVNQEVGGYHVGDVIAANTSVLDVVKNILYAYICPTLQMSGDIEEEVGNDVDVTISYGATDSSSAAVSKLKLYKDNGETPIETQDPAVSGTIYSYNDLHVTAAVSYTIELYDSVKGFLNDPDHKKIMYVNFYYKYFMGYVAKTGTDEYPHIDTSALVRGLTTKTGFANNLEVTIVGNVNTDSTAYFLVVCVPEEYSVSAQNVFGGDYDVQVLPNVVSVNVGGGSSATTKNYKVYYIGSTPSYKNLKISSI